MFQRISALSLVVLFALAVMPAYAQQATPAATASTIIVTNLNDDGPGSLRQAIADAEPNNIITFSSGLSGNIDLKETIRIHGNITIDGGINNISISDATGGLLFEIDKVNFSISHMTLRDSVNAGGALDIIFNMMGAVHISNCTFDNIYGSSVSNLHGTLVISASQFLGNSGASASIINAGISSIDNSTFSNNRVSVYNSNTLTISSSTFYSNNFSTSSISNEQNSYLTIVNSTFDNNTGALSNGGNATLLNDTFAYNGFNSSRYTIEDINYSSTTVKNSILVSSGTNCNGSGIIDGGNNLQFPGGDCGATILVVDPKLAPLATNGGITMTMALLPGSPAIGAANSSVCGNSLVGGIDQRGQTRVTSCDIGAFQTSAILATPQQ